MTCLNTVSNFQVDAMLDYYFKKTERVGCGAQAFNPSIQEAEAGRTLGVQGQPGHRASSRPDLVRSCLKIIKR